MVALLLALSTTAAIQAGKIARCDLVEINHYCPDGSEQFVQAIAWDWSPQYRRYDVQQWVLVSNWRTVPGGIVIIAANGDAIHIRSSCLRETWTEKDPERENLKLFPMDQRRKVW
jgi:hypothetical protein